MKKTVIVAAVIALIVFVVTVILPFAIYVWATQPIKLN